MLVTGLVCCVTVATLLVAAILGASAYESVVVSYSWAARPEEAVGHYRALGAIVTPARFFRRLAPLSQIPAPRLEAVAREWRRGNAMRVVLVAIAFLALLRALWVIARHVAP